MAYLPAAHERAHILICLSEYLKLKLNLFSRDMVASRNLLPVKATSYLAMMMLT